MIDIKKKIELLAPAKNKECAFIAINAGADAVYIGASDFGARKKAGNSLDDIRDVVNYAHIFNVKVYVTVNTILFDNELKHVETLIWKLYELGVDAIIFQDFSFFEMKLPPIALHASTQCNNDSLEKIKFLKSMNVDRVVLPREFSLLEINNVVKNIDIETEVFVHGALCVSYSGQCYMSNYIGGRSANRGECAQPCRKKYSLIDEDGKVILKNRYLLSMKDNNLSSSIKELIDSGVTSLKIEGRLKDSDYVANVTAYYRKLIDKLSESYRSSFGICSHNEFNPNVNKTFNRLYTNFYFDGKRKDFTNSYTPKFMGEYIGKVKTLHQNKITLDQNLDLNVSDKLTYFDKDGELTGTTIKRVFDNGFEVLNSGLVKIGTKMYRNYDSAFYKNLNNANFTRKLPVKFYVSNENITLESITGVITEIKFDASFDKANNIEKSKESIIKQLSKLGDTCFVCESLTISDDFDLFVPISQINEYRRQLSNDLYDKILDKYEPTKRTIIDKLPDYPVKNLDYSFNISNASAQNFYEKCNSKVCEYSPECNKSFQKEMFLMKTKNCLRYNAGLCTKKSRYNKKLYLVDEFGCRFPLEFDCKNCIMKVMKPV